MPIRPLESGPLTSREIQELDAFLHAEDGLENPMDFYTFDGFIWTAPEEVEPHRPGVDVLTGHAKRMVMVPERGRPLVVLESGRARLPGDTPLGEKFVPEELVPSAFGGEIGWNILRR
jgi:hypothetical protein